MGIWRSVHASSAQDKVSRSKVRKPLVDPMRRFRRGLALEPLEARVLMAIGPQIVSITPNEGENLLLDGIAPDTALRNVAPRELKFRFNDGQIIDANTLAGIRITRSGGDGIFDDDIDGIGDDVFVDPIRAGAAGAQRGFVGIGEFPNEVVIRFADTLPDDLYQITIVGDASDNPLRNVGNEPFNAGSNLVVQMDLQRGAQISAIVPQPITRDASTGALTQHSTRVDVYFNEQMAVGSVNNPAFYQLVFTNGTATNADDHVFSPQSVNYTYTPATATSPAVSKAELTFLPAQLAMLDGVGTGQGTYRLRVGDNDTPPAQFVNGTGGSLETPIQLNPTDAGSSFTTANTQIGTLGTVPNGSTSRLIDAFIDAQGPVLQLPGATWEPGHREIADENHYLIPPVVGVNPFGPLGDGTNGMQTLFYHFPQTVTNNQGSTFPNIINAAQKQRFRDIMEMYQYYYGIRFVESTSSGLPIAVADLRAADPTRTSGPGGTLAVAGPSLLVMDSGDFALWGENEFGGNFFQVGMHEFGHSIGLGHTTELPNITIQSGFYPGIFGNDGEPVFPGDHDIVHGQHLYRPDSKDIDLYRFQLDTNGKFSATTFAERQANSSLLDSVITVYSEYDSLRVLATGTALENQSFTMDDDVNGLVTFVFDSDDSVVETSTLRVVRFSTADSKAVIAGKIAAAINNTPALNAEAFVDGERLKIKSASLNTVTPAPIAISVAGAPALKLTLNEREIIARNDDYYSEDSNVELRLGLGEYYVVVTSTGNTNFDPTIDDSGIGGTTNGAYQLRIDFAPDPTGRIVDLDPGLMGGTALDGDGDGRPGGAFNFWFQTVANTIFVDKNYDGPVSGPLGSITNPYDNITDAFAAAETSPNNDIVRILGTGGLTMDPAQMRAYEIGENSSTLAALSDGRFFEVPQGVTVMIDEGAVFKMRKANIDAGSSAQGVDRSEGHVQVLGTPGQSVVFTSWHNEAVGIEDADDGLGLPNITTVPQKGDWGGLVFRNELDYSEAGRRVLERDGIFLNYVNLADISYGGGKVLINGLDLPWDPIHMEQARPTITNNTITNSTKAAISADPDSFLDNKFRAPSYTADYERIGPEIHGNRLTVYDGAGQIVATNSINGLFIRVVQDSGLPAREVTIPTRWDDTDIVHVLQENLIIRGTPGGPVFNSVTGLRDVRQDARLNIDPGLIVKLDGARIETQISAQLLAEGTAQNPIIFTSLRDDRYGAGGTFDTNSNTALPTPANWGGLYFGHASTASLDHVYLGYGGGETRIEGGSAEFNAIEIHQADVRIANSTLQFNASGDAGGSNRTGRGPNVPATIFVRGAQPVIVNNLIRDNAADAININANAMQGRFRPDHGRATGVIDAYTQFDDNHGPLVRLNRLGNNDQSGGVNGMVVRGAVLTTDSVWDDTDIVHVLRDEISVLNLHTYNGLRLQSSPTESLVIKLAGANAGFTAGGTPLDINDRVGGAIQIVGFAEYPVVLTSLADSSIGAGFNPTGEPQTQTVSAGTPAAGDWRSVRFEKYSNDRNSVVVNEVEKAYTGGLDVNNLPGLAQTLGELAPDVKSGDDNRRLGFEVHGAIAQDDTTDVDVYTFKARSGTEVWFDIDRTTHALDTVIELIDAAGRVIARSDDSGAESTAALAFPGTIGLPGVGMPTVTGSGTQQLARIMQRDALDTPHGLDFYTTNPRDAGMRVVLPGAQGLTNNYYVRVRSKGAAGQMENVKGGLTSGQYQLQIRLAERDEFPGSTIRYADMRYGGGGTPVPGSQAGTIELMGVPYNSPLVSESRESTADNTAFDSAQNLGNLLQSNRNTLSISGNISSPTDIDFYRFSLNYHMIQAGGGNFATVFDLDYGDNAVGGNNTIYVYDQTGRLIYVGRDSNISDDQPDPTDPGSSADLSRGSFGELDPYIGTVSLPAGVTAGAGQTYFVAVTSDRMQSSVLQQYVVANPAGGSLTRLEPIGSIRRIAEDHINSLDNAATHPSAATAPLFGAVGARTTLDLNAHAAPFNLSDVTLYVQTQGTNGELYTVDPFTGRLESTITAGSQVINGVGTGFYDIAMRNDGRLYGYAGPNIGAASPGAIGNFFEFEIGTGTTGLPIGSQQNLGDDGVVVVPTPNPANYGTVYEAIAFTPGSINQRALYAIGRQVGGSGVNHLYRMNPNTGAEDLPNQATAVAPSNPLPLGTVTVVNPGTEIITGLTYNPNTSTMFAVSSEGRLYTMGVGSTSTTEITLSGLTGTPSFTGLTIGPQNVENGIYANTLFATATDGRLYAFGIDGVAHNIFAINPNDPTDPGRTSSVQIGVSGNIEGLAFSTLDYNLWHVTNRRGSLSVDDEGHGIYPTQDSSRINRVAGSTSYYFGIEDPRVNTTISSGQFPDWSNYIQTNSSIFNTYNLPGGAKGALTTNSFSLADYTADDRPVLYFNYFLETENVNSTAGNLATMLDSARVFLSTDGGATWNNLLATNNSLTDPFLTAPPIPPNVHSLDTELPEFLSTSETSSFDPRQRIQELFDNTGGWRQARISLGDFAGFENLKLRFDFSTASDISDPNSPGFYREVLEGDRFADTRDQNRRGSNANAFEGFFIDDIIIGFAERGEMVTNAPADSTGFVQLPVDPASEKPDTLVGEYQLEIRRGQEYGDGTPFGLYQTHDTNDRNVQGFSLDVETPLFNVTTPAEALVTATPTIFNIPAPISAGGGLLTIVAESNLASSSEYLTISFESGRADERLFVTGGKDGEPVTITLQLTESQLAAWSADGVITFTITPSADVEAMPGDTVELTLEYPEQTTVADGDTFRISDGVSFVTFEYNSVGGVTGTNRPVNFTPGSSQATIAAAITAAINAAEFAGLFNVRARHHSPTSNRLDLFDAAYVDVAGATNLTKQQWEFTSPPFGIAARARIGDQNHPRDQGLVVVSNTSVAHSAGYGIVLDNDVRDNNNNIPNPGPVHNFSTGTKYVGGNNGLAPGAVLRNNLIFESGVGGILVSGDPNLAGQPLAAHPFARIINNTVYGTATRRGVGIQVTQNASPTLINNIVSNFVTGVQIDASSIAAGTVMQGTLYKDNNTAANTGAIGLGSFAINLDDPGESNRALFVDAASGNFYLAAGSKAIDSSVENLADRSAYANLKQTIGIPQSQIFAPERDLFGSLRVDDPTVTPTVPGLGSNTFIDRGALERVNTLTIGDVTIDPERSVLASIPVLLTRTSSEIVTVVYTTADGTAVFGADYQTTTGTLTFNPGETTKNVLVQVLDDLLDEDNETFIINLTSGANAVIADAQAVVTIVDNDPLPSVSIDDLASIPEGDSGPVLGVFTLTLSAPSGRQVLVNYSTSNGTATTGAGDYNATSGVATFAPGSLTQKITVQALGDTVVEADETFFVNLTGAVNATISDNQGQATIHDDDAKLSINDTAVNEPDMGTVNAEFTVTLSGPSPVPISVEYTVAPGTAVEGDDYQPASGVLNFAPGETTQKITVAVEGDLIDEDLEDYVVLLSNPTNAIVLDGFGIGSIIDNDPSPLASITPSAHAEGDAGISNAVFTVSLADVSGRLVTVVYSTAVGGSQPATAGVDFNHTMGTLTFQPGVTTQQFTVQVLGDTIREPNETFLMQLSPGNGNATLPVLPVEGTILDDEARAVVRDGGGTEDVDGFATLFVDMVDPVTGLFKAAATDIVVTYDTAPHSGTAQPGVDYTPTSGTLTFLAGETQKIVSVGIVSDLLDENDETFVVNLAGAALTIADNQGTGTIIDNDPLPSLAIDSVSVIEGHSGTVDMVFTVTLTPVSGRTVTVAYATADNAAVSTEDYAATSGMLTFVEGVTAQQITVQVNGDTKGEPNEDFFVNLSGAVNAVIGAATGTGTIIDDEPRVSITPHPTTIVEGDGADVTINFTVTLSQATSLPVTVVFQTAPGLSGVPATPGVDYRTTGGTLLFNPGETVQTIPISVVGDLLDEFDETFRLELPSSTNALVISPAAEITISDNDPLPEFSISDVTVTEGDAGTVNAVLTVSLNVPSGRDVTVGYHTADGTATDGADYLGQVNMLDFPAGTTTRQITIPVNGDIVAEGDEQFSVILTNFAPVHYTIVDNAGVVTIIDDEPKISISNPLVIENDIGTAAAVFTLTLDKAGAVPITVVYTTAGGSAIEGVDYQATTGTVTFSVGQTARLVTANVLGDLLDENDESFQVQLSSAVNASIIPGGGVATIIDNDPLPSLAVQNASVLEGDSPNTANMVFTVVLSPVSGREVTVAYSTAAGTATSSDFTATQGTLTFAAGETARQVTVLVTGDGIPEIDETFFLGLSNTTNAVIGTSPGVGTILDDEPRLSISDISQQEGTGTTTDFVFDVTLTRPSTNIITVDYATVGDAAVAGVDFTPTANSLMFGIGETVKKVTVSVAADALDEFDEQFSVLLSNPTNSLIIKSQGVATIVDDDPLPSMNIGAVSVLEGDSGTTDAVLVVTLNAPSGRLVTADYATIAGTATASDFNATAGQIVFTPGATTALITVQVRGDSSEEPDEQFTVSLSNLVHASPAGVSAPVTIRDDDARVNIEAAKTVVEGDSGFQNVVFAVTLNKPTGDGASVSFTTQPGSAAANADFVPTSGTLIFAPNETVKFITVQVNGDTADEADETFSVRLTVLNNSLLPGNLNGVLTITDDDLPPTVSVGDVTVTEGNVAGGVANVIVSLSSASGQQVTVVVTTFDGSATAASGDYVGVNTTLTFAPGESTKAVPVAIGGDLRSELSESFSVVLSAPTNASLGDAQGIVTILDNDPQHFLVTGADAGGGPHVRVFNSLTGTEQFSFFAYGIGFTGGVRVASADVNGDGQPDIITAPGRGGGPHVRVFDGRSGAVIRDFFAFEPTFTKGLNIAAGDVNGDGKADIMVSTDGDIGESFSRVRIFDGATGGQIRELGLAGDSGLAAGARIAAGDITGDGRSDVILAAGPGQLPRVVVFNGFTGATVANFQAYGPGATMGMYVAAGDFNGDGRADIITGAGAGGGPHVRIFSGAGAAVNSVNVLGEFFAFGGFTGGVRVGATDYNGDGVADVIAAAGPGGGPHVRVLSGPGLTELASFFAYGLFSGGVHTAGSFRTLGTPLMAAPSGTAPAGGAAEVSLDELRPLINQAISNWADAGLDSRLLNRLSQVEFRLGDLPAGYLGMAYPDAIVLDRDAAGYGWFVDSTPGDDEEFDLASDGLKALQDSAAAQGIDLLTVIAHELGHSLGLTDLHSHVDDSVMAESLGTGERRRPGAAEVDALFGDGPWTK